MILTVLRCFAERVSGPDQAFRNVCLRGLQAELREVPWETGEGLRPERRLDAGFAADYRRALHIQDRATRRWPRGPSTENIMHRWLTLLGWRLAVEQGYDSDGHAAVLDYIVDKGRVRRSALVHWTDVEVVEALVELLSSSEEDGCA